MNDRYYINLDGADQGPFTLKQLQGLWNAGRIHSETPYWKDGFQSQLKLEDIIERLEPKKSNSGNGTGGVPLPTHKPYRRPILSTLYYFCAIVCLVVGLGTAFMMTRNSTIEQLGMGYAPVGMGVSAIVTALIFFGLGQVVEYFARTAYYAEQLAGTVPICTLDLKEGIRHTLRSVMSSE